MRALWFLLRVALAGPPWEKPPSSSRINAGTAEPVRVSPPEAVAYLLELKNISEEMLVYRILGEVDRHV
jgi:hypothetical protein